MNKDIKELTGEELASILSGQYEQLMLTQQNIQTIKQELKRREEVKSKEVEKPKEEKKE